MTLMSLKTLHCLGNQAGALESNLPAQTQQYTVGVSKFTHEVSDGWSSSKAHYQEDVPQLVMAGRSCLHTFSEFYPISMPSSHRLQFEQSLPTFPYPPSSPDDCLMRPVTSAKSPSAAKLSKFVSYCRFPHLRHPSASSFFVHYSSDRILDLHLL